MPQTMRPTVLVGLGGTGKEVLLRIRRKFFDRYGDLTACPNVAYVVFDTDTTDQFLSREVKDSRLFKRIELKGDELLHTPLDPQFPLRGRDFEENHSHIARWWIRSIQDIEATRVAGQVRAKGRLAFFQRYPMIRRTLERKRDQVMDPEAFNRTNRNPQFGGQLVFDQKARFYIVGSLAGGTGSGMFLDVCFLLKHIAPEAQRMAFFVLPEVFGDAAKLYANAYAALMELDYYNIPSTAYDFKWTPDMREPPEPIQGPMLNYCFLVGGKNQADRAMGSGEGGRCTLFEMMAENIFHEFGLSEVADQKQRLRDNIVQYADPERMFPPEKLDEARSQIRESGTGSFPCRYFSFGLATLSHPVDRVRRAMAYALAAQTVRRMLEGPLPGAGSASGASDLAALVDPLMAVLAEVPDKIKPDADLSRIIMDWESKAKRRLLADGKAFEAGYGEEVGTLARMFEDRGTISEAMRTRLAGARTALRESLVKTVGELVSFQFAGVTKVREALVEVRRRALGDATSRANTLAQTLTEKADQIEKGSGGASAIEELKAEVDEVLEWGLRPVAGWLLKQTAFDLKARELIEEHRAQAIRRLEGFAYRQAIKLLEEVLEELAAARTEVDPSTRQARLVYEGEARQLQDAATGLKDLVTYLEQMHVAFRRPVESSLIFNLYDEANFDAMYYKPYTEKLQLENLGLEVLAAGSDQGLFDQPTVKALARRCEGNKEEDVGDWIATTLMHHFSDIFDHFDVLKLMYDRFPRDRVEKEVANHFQGSQVWLQSSQVAARAAFTLGAGQVQRLAARNQTSPQAGSLDDAVRHAAGASPPALYSISDKNHAVFYQEIGGFPLFYAKAVEEYRSKYVALIRHQQSAPETAVHLFEGYHVLPDIYYPTDQERERLKEARMALLMGTTLGLLRVLKPREGSDQPRFEYLVRRTGRTPEPWALGERFVALRELSGPASDERRKWVLEEIASTSAKLQSAGFNEKLYMLVSALMLSPRFSHWREEAGGNRRRFVTLEYQFLEEIQGGLSEGFRTLPEADQERITDALTALGPDPEPDVLVRFLSQVAENRFGEWQLKGAGVSAGTSSAVVPGAAAR